MAHQLAWRALEDELRAACLARALACAPRHTHQSWRAYRIGEQIYVIHSEPGESGEQWQFYWNAIDSGQSGRGTATTVGWQIANQYQSVSVRQPRQIEQPRRGLDRVADFCIGMFGGFFLILLAIVATLLATSDVVN